MERLELIKPEKITSWEIKIKQSQHSPTVTFQFHAIRHKGYLNSTLMNRKCTVRIFTGMRPHIINTLCDGALIGKVLSGCF